MKQVTILCLTLAACEPAMPNIPAGCRDFSVGTWNGGEPWGDIDLSRVARIDEHLLKGNPDGTYTIDYEHVPERLAEVKAYVAAAHAEGKEAWVNWSTEEYDLLYRSVWPDYFGWDLDLGADAISFDSYGGPVDWWWQDKVPRMLGDLVAKLRPGQKILLIPEGIYCKSCGIAESEDDYIKMSALYFDWGMRHHGVVRAFVPYTWTCDPPNLCIAEMPRLRDYLANLVAEHPKCQEASP